VGVDVVDVNVAATITATTTITGFEARCTQRPLDYQSQLVGFG
jgi:hypothetical protein